MREEQKPRGGTQRSSLARKGDLGNVGRSMGVRTWCWSSVVEGGKRLFLLLAVVCGPSYDLTPKEKKVQMMPWPGTRPVLYDPVLCVLPLPCRVGCTVRESVVPS